MKQLKQVVTKANLLLIYLVDIYITGSAAVFSEGVLQKSNVVSVDYQNHHTDTPLTTTNTKGTPPPPNME